MDKKLIVNYIYNILYQLVKVALPLVLVPYTASHVGAPTLGIYNYAGSIMNWFILFGILGVNTYGNRQIAKVRDNKEEMNRTFFEVLIMQMTDMIIAMGAFYLFVTFAIKKNQFYWYLTGFTMLASMLDITWFFYGIEDFKKASIRNIIVKCLGVGLIMLLVKKPEDLWLYILINIGSELVGQAIMFVQLRQYITFERVSVIDAYKHHFIATFQLFVPTIAISVYTMLDESMVGFLYSEEHVTYYRTSMNIVKMFLYFITSIGSVMLPRVTNVFYNSDNGADQAKNLVNTTMKIACLLAFPMCFGMMAIAPNFIAWYIPTWPIVSQLIVIGCPVIIFISMSNVTGIQYMVPTGMYNLYTGSVVAGATINCIFNLIMIPKYGAFGAIIGSLLAEFTVTATELVMIRSRVHIDFKQKSYLIYAIGSLLMFVLVRLAGTVLPANAFGTLVQVGIGVVVYFVMLVCTKEDLCMKVLSKLKRS